MRHGREFARVAAVHGAVALYMVRAGLGTGAILGQPWGESWGRLYATGQVARWLHGTPIGHADLVAFPGGRPWWPVDPLLQLLAVPLEAAVGESSAWALCLGALSWSAGLGGAVLAHTLGAPWLRAAAAGLVLQLAPTWLRNGSEGITEALALGPPALACAATIQLLRAPSRARGWAFLGACVLVCGTSPYYATYGGIALAVSALAWGRGRWGLAARVVGAAALVAAIAAAPLLLTESGAGGRLDATRRGGYQLQPAALVIVDADGTARPRPRAIPVPRVDGPAPSVLTDLGQRQWPLGVGALFLLAAGMVVRGARGAAATGIAVLVLGPLWGPLRLHALGLPVMSPIEWLLRTLPLTSFLGNTPRLAAVALVAATATAGPVLARSRVLAITTAALAWLAARAESPRISLPAMRAEPPAALVAAITGPTITFPNADPPAWNPGAWAKQGLWLAKHHGGAQAYDFGRGGVSADTAALVRLSQVSGMPVAAAAARSFPPGDDAELWTSMRGTGFSDVLVLRWSLSDAQWSAIAAYLSGALGAPVATSGEGGTWRL
jgi:hypothetical protein